MSTNPKNKDFRTACRAVFMLSLPRLAKPANCFGSIAEPQSASKCPRPMMTHDGSNHSSPEPLVADLPEYNVAPLSVVGRDQVSPSTVSNLRWPGRSPGLRVSKYRERDSGRPHEAAAFDSCWSGRVGSDFVWYGRRPGASAATGGVVRPHVLSPRHALWLRAV